MWTISDLHLRTCYSLNVGDLLNYCVWGFVSLSSVGSLERSFTQKEENETLNIKCPRGDLGAILKCQNSNAKFMSSIIYLHCAKSQHTVGSRCFIL